MIVQGVQAEVESSSFASFARYHLSCPAGNSLDAPARAPYPGMIEHDGGLALRAMR
jgi:hypothetical protein